MPTPTDNYAFNLPTPGGDEDSWGVLLSANWTVLDTLLFSGALGASAASLTTARTLTVGGTGKTFNGTANVTWTLAEIGAADRTLTLTTGDGLTGGGNLTANRTLAVDGTVVRTARTITAGTGLSGGGTLAADRTINIANGGVGTTQLADGAVTTAKLGTISASTFSENNAGRDWVGGRTAALGWDAVGAYVFAYRSGTIIENSTYAGSGLFPAGGKPFELITPDTARGTAHTRGPNSLSGTWRAAGRSNHSDGVTLFKRIS